MKKLILLAAASILALSPVAVNAQTNQPSPGASTQGNVGPDNTGTMKKGTTTGSSTMRDQGGNSKGQGPARSGAGNTNNMESQAGGGAGGAGGGAGGAGGSGN